MSIATPILPAQHRIPRPICAVLVLCAWLVLAAIAYGQPTTFTYSNLNQGPNDNLLVRIEGAGIPGVDYDLHNVLGNAMLDGRVELRFDAGYQPAIGESINFLQAQTIEQQFRSYFFPIAPPDEVAVQFEQLDQLVRAEFVSPRFGNDFQPTGPGVSQWHVDDNWSLGEIPNSTDQLVLMNNSPIASQRVRVIGDPIDGFAPAAAHEIAIQGGLLPMILEVNGGTNGVGHLSVSTRTAIDNEGQLELVNQGSLFTGELLVGNKGTVLLDNGHIETGVAGARVAGLLAGTGQVSGDFQLLPGGLLEVQEPAGGRGGQIMISQNYSQSPGSRLALDLPSDNPGEYEQLFIGGTASFGGVLQVNLTEFDGFGVGTRIEQVVYAETGVGQNDSFRRLDAIGLPTGIWAKVEYGVGSYYASIEGHSVGDMDGDFDFDQEDVDLFVLALRDREAYELTPLDGGGIIGVSADITGDTDFDGDMDFDDIDDMIALLDGSAAVYARQVLLGVSVPEPGTLSLLFLACLAVVRWRKS